MFQIVLNDSEFAISAKCISILLKEFVCDLFPQNTPILTSLLASSLHAIRGVPIHGQSNPLLIVTLRYSPKTPANSVAHNSVGLHQAAPLGFALASFFSFSFSFFAFFFAAFLSSFFLFNFSCSSLVRSTGLKKPSNRLC